MWFVFFSLPMSTTRSIYSHLLPFTPIYSHLLPFTPCTTIRAPPSAHDHHPKVQQSVQELKRLGARPQGRPSPLTPPSSLLSFTPRYSLLAPNLTHTPTPSRFRQDVGLVGHVSEPLSGGLRRHARPQGRRRLYQRRRLVTRS